ncbi:hypothetical protein J4214_05460 [Candidatus Woesearchaeota archaeon]|nr:hypothetical protein [Candidatus Woesearchaeota archaeon]
MKKILRRFRFSKHEVIDLLKAWIVISLAFAIVLTPNKFSMDLLYNILLAAITVGVGFLLHELAHKKLAQKYGCLAEFIAFDSMLLFALLTSFLGIVFAAPGAVFISGNVNIERNGRISAAGPITNLILAFIFLIMQFFTVSGTFLEQIASYGFIVNSWLALFNMIPFWNFDGKKVFYWNKTVYLTIVVIAVVFLFFINSIIQIIHLL